jgi:hypothetical protein
MIFICNIIIYPLIKKNKIQPCVLIKYRYRIQEPEKAYKQWCVFIETKKNLHNILGVSVLGPVGTRPDRLKPVGTRSD